jgi:hypothetical protein
VLTGASLPSASGLACSSSTRYWASWIFAPGIASSSSRV